MQVKLHESDGLRADNAAIQGVLQMSSPIFASALTTVVAFIPVFLVDGSFGAIVKPIPLTVILVLIASLLECYFILPAHMYYALLKSSTDKKMKHNKLIAYLIKDCPSERNFLSVSNNEFRTISTPSFTICLGVPG